MSLELLIGRRILLPITFEDIGIFTFIHAHDWCCAWIIDPVLLIDIPMKMGVDQELYPVVELGEIHPQSDIMFTR